MASTEKQRQIALNALAEGASLRKACEQADIQSPAYFLTEMQADDALAEQYTRARQIGYTLLGDDLQAVSDDINIPADHRRIMVDTRKWMLSKMLPKIYGDKLDLTAKVTTDKQMSDAELMAIAARKAPGGDVQKG